MSTEDRKDQIFIDPIIGMTVQHKTQPELGDGIVEETYERKSDDEYMHVVQWSNGEKTAHTGDELKVPHIEGRVAEIPLGPMSEPFEFTHFMGKQISGRREAKQAMFDNNMSQRSISGGVYEGKFGEVMDAKQIESQRQSRRSHPLDPKLAPESELNVQPLASQEQLDALDQTLEKLGPKTQTVLRVQVKKEEDNDKSEP